jgi:hypothetical protein
VDPSRVAGNGSAPTNRLTRAEIAAARIILGPVAARFGYAPPEGLQGGVGELARLTFRAGAFYVREAVRSPDMRGRIRRLVGA